MMQRTKGIVTFLITIPLFCEVRSLLKTVFIIIVIITELKFFYLDWLSVRLFVIKSALNHVGIQLQKSNLNFLKLDTCSWIAT